MTSARVRGQVRVVDELRAVRLRRSRWPDLLHPSAVNPLARSAATSRLAGDERVEHDLAQLRQPLDAPRGRVRPPLAYAAA